MAVRRREGDRSGWAEAVREQRVCAVCGKARRAHGHHVVYEQHLPPDQPRYHPDNALRTCPGPLECHRQHHGGNRVIKTGELTERNIAFAFRVLGPYAYDYLRRRYDDSDSDIRLEAHLDRIAA